MGLLTSDLSLLQNSYYFLHVFFVTAHLSRTYVYEMNIYQRLFHL